MIGVIQKKLLKDGYYYSGYIHQHYCVILSDQPLIIGKWDSSNNCFWFWEFEANRKTKRKLLYLFDIDNEIEEGFFPINEVIPKENHVIE